MSTALVGELESQYTHCIIWRFRRELTKRIEEMNVSATEATEEPLNDSFSSRDILHASVDNVSEKMRASTSSAKAVGI